MIRAVTPKMTRDLENGWVVSLEDSPAVELCHFQEPFRRFPVSSLREQSPRKLEADLCQRIHEWNLPDVSIHTQTYCSVCLLKAILSVHSIKAIQHDIDSTFSIVRHTKILSLL